MNMQTREGKSALMLASSNGHCDVIKLLLEKGAKVNLQDSNGQTSLIYASMCGKTEVVQLLIKYNADTSIMETLTGRTAIDMAIEEGHSDIVELLLNCTQSVHSRKREISPGPDPVHSKVLATPNVVESG